MGQEGKANFVFMWDYGLGSVTEQYHVKYSFPIFN